MGRPQLSTSASNDQKDHIWFKLGQTWKCCLCGAISAKPLDYPTPPTWMPERYYPLTDQERQMARNK
jgi:hypothetical protein